MNVDVALMCAAGALSLPSALLMFRRDTKDGTAAEMTVGTAITTALLGTGVSGGWVLGLLLTALMGSLANSIACGRSQRLPLLFLSVAALFVYLRGELTS